MSRVRVEVVLRDPRRAAPVDIVQAVDAKYAGNQEFMWTEGNYGCDCNKRLFIARRLGEPEPDPNPCGDEVRLERLEVAGELVLERRANACAN